jgi:hypothetical protein
MSAVEATAVNSDFSALLSCLNACRAKYLVVGGQAVIQFAEPRYTKDLDILVEPSVANARRVHEALERFMGRLDAVGPETLAEPGLWLKLGRAPVRIDILTSIPGVRFQTAWRNRVVVRIGAVAVKFISPRDLIRNKRAVGRHVDLADVEALTLAAKRRR